MQHLNSRIAVFDRTVLFKTAIGFIAAAVIAILTIAGGVDAQTAPTSKNDCKNGGYQDFGFRNQGLCIQYVNRLGTGYGYNGGVAGVRNIRPDGDPFQNYHQNLLDVIRESLLGD
jgi:hypothetical protein